MKFTLLALITSLFLISSCKKETTTASAINAPVGSCIIGKWPDSSLPLSIKMSAEFDGDYSNADLVSGLNPLEQMAKVWNTAASPKTLITLPFGATATSGYVSTSSYRDSEIGIYKSSNWFTNVSSSALAITQFYGVVTSNPGLGQYIELTHADIIVNYDDYGPRLTMINNPLVEFDVPTVVLHELGHLLGLCHQSSKPSIMAPYYLTTQRNLQNFDRDIIKDIYVDGAITALSTKSNVNAISAPKGTEVRGIIELKKDGECTHYLEGKKIYQHFVELKKKK